MTGENKGRSFGRAADEMRPVTLTPGVMMNAEGSCLAQFGNTKVLCSATIEEGVPRWRKDAGAGWITAEYAMLPASTNHRTPREYKGRKGRSMEIERLIGRSLRAVCDMRRIDGYTITLDCDVIQADGGTRTASITGAWVALHDAVELGLRKGWFKRTPITGQVAAPARPRLPRGLQRSGRPQPGRLRGRPDHRGTGYGRASDLQPRPAECPPRHGPAGHRPAPCPAGAGRRRRHYLAFGLKITLFPYAVAFDLVEKEDLV